MTYAFLCMGRFNLIVAKNALGPLMGNQDLGIIFAAGTLTYALSFLVNGPLIDKKIGGKNGMLISAAGAALSNIALGVLTWYITVRHLKVNLVAAFSVIYSINMYFQSYGAMSIIKVKAYWFHVRERGVFGAIFGTFISAGNYFAFDWSSSIVSMTKANAADNYLKRIFGSSGVDATWAVFFIPAVILIAWLIVDFWLIKDIPEQAGFPHLDTSDASSGQMHIQFSVLDLLKKGLRQPADVDDCHRGTDRRRFPIQRFELVLDFFEPGETTGRGIYRATPGLAYTRIFRIVGGFAGGIVSDRIFQSRRGPPAAFLCGLVLVLSIVMAMFVFTNPLVVGWSVVLIFMASIGVTSLMSGTAATDFGGRKATATCMGIVDACAYLGSVIQSIGIAFLVPDPNHPQTVTVPFFGFTRSWQWWPILIIPFTILGGVIAIWIWNELPAATKKYIAENEKKQGLTGTEIPLR